MRKLITLASLLSFFIAAKVFAADSTKIVDHEIISSQLLDPADRNGFTMFMGVIDGKVTFEGEAPVYVTLKNNYDSYTTLTDREGRYTFFFYIRGRRDYTLTAWTPGGEQEAELQLSLAPTEQ